MEYNPAEGNSKEKPGELKMKKINPLKIRNGRMQRMRNWNEKKKNEEAMDRKRKDKKDS